MKKFSILIIIIVMTFSCGTNETIMQGSENKVSLEFPEVKTTLSLKSKIWGISGNHELTLISVDQNLKDSTQTQIFHTSEIYYRSDNNNTLLVYAPYSSFTTTLDSIGKVKLIVIPINNADTIKALARTYKKRGLSRLSALDKTL